MIELGLLILFFISIFAIIRSGRGDNEEVKKEKEETMKSAKKSLWWHMWHDESDGTTYPGYTSHNH